MLRFLVSLSEAASLVELENRFRAGFGRLVSGPMYGFNVLEPADLRLEHNVAVNVTDGFVTRYAQDAMERDPLRAHAFSTGRAAYNRALMPAHEWEDSEVYRAAYSIHQMRLVVEAPILGVNGEQLGGVHVGSSERVGFDPPEVELVELVGRALGAAIGNMRAREGLEMERDQAWLALEISGAAVVTTRPGARDAELTDAAKRLLENVVDAAEALHRLLARPGETGFSRRIDVLLSNGDNAILSAHSTPFGSDGGLATVLDLRSEAAALCSAPLGALTRREAEVAVLVSEGLGDREIADCLNLSHHTVSQYVKRIYRKLEVDSRVALTRLLLGAPLGARSVR